MLSFFVVVVEFWILSQSFGVKTNFVLDLCICSFCSNVAILVSTYFNVRGSIVGHIYLITEKGSTARGGILIMGK